jgi:APA family basic amino acid/polyamine antiporter
VPVLGMGFCGWLMLSLPAATWIAFAIWLVIGLLVYFAWSQHHSELNNA